MMTLFKGEGGILKESDTSRDEVAICVSRISNPFEVMNNQEDILYGFSGELVLLESKNMNKTDTTKDTKRKAGERLIRKK